MKKLGISIYPEKIGEKETIDYIKSAKKYGFSRIFANLLDVNNDKDGREHIDLQTRVFKYAKEEGFEIILDVNPEIYRNFNIKNTETAFFKKMNVSGIRLDEDFKGTVETELTKNKDNLLIELNASGSLDTILKVIESGGDKDKLLACYNFYPQKFTGQDFSTFLRNGTILGLKNIRVGAFITLDKEKNTVGPWKINDGMPTLEIHRYMSIEDQVEEMLKFPFISDIIISQQPASEKTLKKIKESLDLYEKYTKSEKIDIKVDLPKNISDLEKKILYEDIDLGMEKGYSDRRDFSEVLIRISKPRLKNKNYQIPPRDSGRKLSKGDVVILNDNKGRYRGEINIIIQDIDDSIDNCRNYIGKVSKEDLNKVFMMRYPRKIFFK